ncbi:polysaccharide pyruvyl transferase family protein [Sphingomonas sp. ID0503]|uniref:polysaccharide pyruvyl transferase family protein n=1 Tax=Sphingomonas sp. ID0503 TaxID=3399691 RepID=UPI003AFB1906
MPGTPSRRIAVTGVFDLQNYGDLMFPVIARHRLSSGFDVVPVAPTAMRPNLSDAIDPVSLAELFGGSLRFDGLLIGGGYMIHALPMDFMPGYGPAGVAEWAGAGLWVGATIAAGGGDMPIAWNAPGVPHRFTPRQKRLMAPVLRAADYVAVRDRGAAQLLDAPADVPVTIVPDPVADLSRMWPRSGLEAEWRALLARKGVSGAARTLAVHLRDRAVAGIAMAEIAAALDELARRHTMLPVLVAVGANHDDPATMRALAAEMQGPRLLLDDPLSLREISAAFAFASLYIGSSLHGYIASASYGVPGVLVARPAYRKFSGFLDHSGRADDLAFQWDEAFAKAAERAASARSTPLPPHVFTALDTHWEHVTKVLAAPSTRRAQRDELLAHAKNQEGIVAMLRPYLSHTGAFSPDALSGAGLRRAGT